MNDMNPLVILIIVIVIIIILLLFLFYKLNQIVSLMEEQNEMIRKKQHGGNLHESIGAKNTEKEHTEVLVKNITSEKYQKNPAPNNTPYEKSNSWSEDYVAPQLKYQNTSSDDSILDGNCEMIHLEFVDGTQGNIYHNQIKNEFFFQRNSKLNVTYYNYENFTNCVTAFHSYMTTGRILRVGYLGIFSN